MGGAWIRLLRGRGFINIFNPEGVVSYEHASRRGGVLVHLMKKEEPNMFTPLKWEELL